MGNLCSCCYRKSEYYDECNEESQRILDNAVGINSGENHEHFYYGSTNVNINSNLSTLNGTNLKQAEENRQNQIYQAVLDRLTARFIDISAIQKSGEQGDLSDREQAINEKLSKVRRHITLSTNMNKTFPRSDYLQKTKDPIPIDDYKQISEIANKTAKAVAEGFKIYLDEPFVVGFDTTE